MSNFSGPKPTADRALLLSKARLPATPTAVLLLCAVVGFVAGCRGGAVESEPDPRRTLRGAVDYLWAQQGADGGWHSATHGLLSGGQAWTPFTAFYLLQVPDSVFVTPGSRVAAALSFVRKHVDRDGAIGLSDPAVLEYPNYATSYAMRVLDRWGADADSSLVRRMQRYLEGQQFAENRGIGPHHRAYGSWGFGETGLELGVAGHIDLSHTRRVLEALQQRDATTTMNAATTYLRMLQKHPSDSRPQPRAEPGDTRPPYDGGFYASTTALGTNKAGLADSGTGSASYFLSYATATCDGVLALLAAGVPLADERVQAARKWLLRHDSLETVPGIEPGSLGQWDRVLFYYHLLVRSEAYVTLGIEDDGWKRRMQEMLAARQRVDGSFSNPAGAPNKEDDPILATAMVVGTLLNTMK